MKKCKHRTIGEIVSFKSVVNIAPNEEREFICEDCGQILSYQQVYGEIKNSNYTRFKGMKKELTQREMASKGGKARAKNLSPERRAEIAKIASEAAKKARESAKNENSST